MTATRSSSRRPKPALAWHFDLHTPGHVRVNEEADPRGIARELKRHEVEEVILFAKCHYGFAYYPTRVGTPHPRMSGDLFGGVLKACRAEGLRVMAYMSFGIDGQAGARHPEWKRVWPDGRTDPDGYFTYLCPFTSYVDELVLPQIREVSERYRPDGFWFDTMSALSSCHCDACQRSFVEETGRPFPKEANDPLRGRHGSWRRERGLKLISRVARFIQELQPGALVSFNQVGSLPFPEPLPEGVNLLALDPPTYGPQSLQFSLYASYGASTGRAIDVMPTIFNQGWGDWSLGSELRLEQVAGAIWARGGRLYAGDRLHPAGRLTPVTRAALRLCSRFRAKVASEFVGTDAHPAPDVLLLHPPSMTYGDGNELFADNPRARMGPLEGAHRLLLDCGASAWAVADFNLEPWLARARLLVLSELGRVEESVAAQIRRFAESGGCVLTVGTLPTVNGQPLDWCGVRPTSTPWQDHVYLPAWKEAGKGGLPVLCRGVVCPAEMKGAERVLPFIAPYGGRAGVKFGWGIGPASDEPSAHAAVTRFRVGKGEVWHLGAPIFSDYHAHGQWHQVAWFTGLLRRVQPESRAFLESTPGSVELVVWENASTTWAILLHHGGEQLIGNTRGLGSWARTLAPLPVLPVRLRLTRRGCFPAKVACGNMDISVERARGTVRIKASVARSWTMVRVDWREDAASGARGARRGRS